MKPRTPAPALQGPSPSRSGSQFLSRFWSGQRRLGSRVGTQHSFPHVRSGRLDTGVGRRRTESSLTAEKADGRQAHLGPCCPAASPPPSSRGDGLTPLWPYLDGELNQPWDWLPSKRKGALHVPEGREAACACGQSAARGRAVASPERAPCPWISASRRAVKPPGVVCGAP